VRKLLFLIQLIALMVGSSYTNGAESLSYTVSLVRIMDTQGFILKGCDTGQKSKSLHRSEIKDFIRSHAMACCDLQKVPGMVIILEYSLGDDGQPMQASYNCSEY